MRRSLAVRRRADGSDSEERYAIYGILPGSALIQPTLVQGRWLEPGDRAHPVHGAPPARTVRQWDPKISRRGKLEAGRHNADDYPGAIDQRDRFAKDFLIAAEASAPQAVTQDHHAVSSRLLFFRRKRGDRRRRTRLAGPFDAGEKRFRARPEIAAARGNFTQGRRLSIESQEVARAAAATAASTLWSGRIRFARDCRTPRSTFARECRSPARACAAATVRSAARR